MFERLREDRKKAGRGAGVNNVSGGRFTPQG